MNCKVSKTFRLSQQTLDQLEVMHDIERKKANLLEIKSPSVTEILERSIGTLYTMMTDEVADGDYLTRMTTLISDSVTRGLSSSDFAFNSMLYDLAVVKEAIFAMVKGGNYPTLQNLVEDIVDKDCIYETVIKNKINAKI